MRIIIDGDACPDKPEIKKLAQKYLLEMIVYIDYAHILEDDYYQVIECEVGRDSVDMKIIQDSYKGDLVITQDYGLAGLLLSKGVQVLHPTGMVIDNDNIDGLLASRYYAAQQRRSQKHLKGPTKRTHEMRTHFLEILESLLK